MPADMFYPQKLNYHIKKTICWSALIKYGIKNLCNNNLTNEQITTMSQLFFPNCLFFTFFSNGHNVLHQPPLQVRQNEFKFIFEKNIFNSV